MCMFHKLRNYINNLDCGSKINFDNVSEKLCTGELNKSEGLLRLYFATLSKAGVLQETDDLSEYTIKAKILEDLTLYDFLDAINGGNFKEWFIKVCQP